MSKDERTGWRDEAISRRHRAYGFAVPMVDLDFLVVEYDYGTPVALIEYKHEESSELRYDAHPSYKALRSLSDASSIPFCVAIYDDDWVYSVIPQNDQAKLHFSKPIILSENEYVEWLYLLRGRSMPVSVNQILNTTYGRYES